MMIDDRGLLSLDLFAATLIVLMTITSMVAITGDRLVNVNSFQEISRAKILAENFAQRIESVYSGGEGYETTYKMPSNISNSPYLIIVDNSGVYVTLNGKMGYAHLIPMKIVYGSYYGPGRAILRPDESYKITNIKDQYQMTYIIIKEI
jgi:hypothetical protein